MNSSTAICNQNHYRTELCNSKCFPSDFSNIDSTKISLSNSAFIYFLILNCSLIINHKDLKIVNRVDMLNNQIVITPSTSAYRSQPIIKFLPNIKN